MRPEEAGDLSEPVAATVDVDDVPRGAGGGRGSRVMRISSPTEISGPSRTC